MKKSICGVDCDKCELNTTCSGCRAHGVMCRPDEIFAYLNEYPQKNEQISLSG